MDWLAFGESGHQAKTDAAGASAGPNPISKTVPMIGLADCGLGAWCTTSPMRVQTNAPDDMLDPDAFAILTTGNSMLPAGIPPGILCFCSPNTRIAAGDAVYVQRYDDTASIKIFQRRDEKFYYLLGYLDPDAEV